MATLGLVGTGVFSADERPKDYRELILRLFPNGQAPLTALLSKMSKERAEDPEFRWFEQETPTQQVFINNGPGYGTGDTTFVIDDGAGADPGMQFVKNHVFLNTRTGELYLVTANQTVGTSIVVSRAAGETAAAALNDNDELIVIGKAHAEGDPIGTAVRRSPTVPFNYTQIFRTPLNITRTAMKTRLRTRSQYLRSKIEALEQHSIEMEKAFIFSERKEANDPTTGEPRRLTRGLKNWITTNSVSFTGGIVGEDDFDDKLEQLFRFGSTEKLALCGSTALNVLNKLAKNKTTINVVAGAQVYGMALVEYVTPFGKLFLRTHPIFNQIATWRASMLILDPPNVKYRWIDDTAFFVHRQQRGDDARKDEFMTEAGLEVHHEKTHGWFTNMNTFQP